MNDSGLFETALAMSDAQFEAFVQFATAARARLKIEIDGKPRGRPKGRKNKEKPPLVFAQIDKEPA